MAQVSRLFYAALAAAFLSSACSASRTPRPDPRVLSDTGGAQLRAGVAEVDITPPPGLGMYGHGFETRVAEGVLLRLRCQVFVLVQGDVVLALAPCDLAAPSLSLQRRVTEHVRAAGIRLDGHQLQLIATHTHAGPAHYFRAANYAGSLSSALPGYDPNVEDFLARRIAGGVVEAAQSLRDATVRWHFKRVTDLTRNRSLAPYLANGGEAHPVDSVGSPAYRSAIDPWLRAFSLWSAEPSERPALMGVFAVFAMHPTVIPNTNVLYHGDVFGFATRFAEQRLAARFAGEARPPVVGLANGTEGDISPDWRVQSVSESRRLGSALADHLVAGLTEGPTVQPPPDAPGELRVAYRELHMAGAPVPVFDATGEDPAPIAPGRLCAVPELGAPAAGGAEDGPTRLRIFPEFNEGVRAAEWWPDPCHGRRIPILLPLGAMRGGRDFPERVPVSVVRIGGRLLGFLPGEVTVIAGRRIRRAMCGALANPDGGPCAPSLPGMDDRDPVAVVSLTNEYIQYITTPEEYEFQHYEGASTLWGPRTADFFAGHLRCLTEVVTRGSPRRCAQPGAWEQGEPLDRASAEVMPAGLEREVLPADGVASEEPFQATAPVVERVRVGDGRTGVRIRWVGVAPFHATSREHLRVEVRDRQGRVVDDDSGTNFEVRVVHDLGAPDEEAVWEARWLPEIPDTHPLQTAPLHFEVHGHQDVRSETFQFAPVTDASVPAQVAP